MTHLEVPLAARQFRPHARCQLVVEAQWSSTFCELRDLYLLEVGEAAEERVEELGEVVRERRGRGRGRFESLSVWSVGWGWPIEAY